MPSLIFNSALLDMANGQIVPASDQFGVILLRRDYQPDQRDHRTRADVEAFEVDGGGYRAGGEVADVSVYLDDEDGLVIALGANRWPRSNIAAGHAAYFKRNGGEASDDRLLAVIDFGEEIVSRNGAFATSESLLRIQNNS